MKRVDLRNAWTLLLPALAVLALAGPASATRLQHVSVGASGDVTRLMLTSDTQLQFTDFSLSDPERIVVDCLNADGVPVAPTFTSDLVKDVSFVRVSGDGGPLTRMIVSLTRRAEYTISQKQSALEVVIQPAAAGANAGLVDVGAASHAGRVSLDVQGADVKTVLRTLAEASGRNIVPSKDVKGEVALSLHNVAWREALDALCKTQALGYKEENGIIRVGPVEQIQNEELNARGVERKAEDLLPLETRIAHVAFANVDELKGPLTSVLSHRGKVDVDARTSSIIITDIPERAEAAEKMVERLDSRTPQITITAKLVDVDVASGLDLGVNWGGSSVSGTVETALNMNKALPDTSGQIRFGTIAPDAHNFLLRLQALASEHKANIISNPTITTVDNREARILVGQKIPLIVADAAGNAVTQLTTIGIQLRVTPHLNSDNKITMDIHPEVSDLATQATVQGGVIINSSEADTRIMVDDGQTAVIGGLIRDNESTLASKIPILGDLPILGHFFRTTSKVKQKRDLMILITPHLVTGTPGKE